MYTILYNMWWDLSIRAPTHKHTCTENIQTDKMWRLSCTYFRTQNSLHHFLFLLQICQVHDFICWNGWTRAPSQGSWSYNAFVRHKGRQLLLCHLSSLLFCCYQKYLPLLCMWINLAVCQFFIRITKLNSCHLYCYTANMGYFLTVLKTPMVFLEQTPNMWLW